MTPKMSPPARPPRIPAGTADPKPVVKLLEALLGAAMNPSFAQPELPALNSWDSTRGRLIAIKSLQKGF
jgi:hypothetical protein